MNAYDLVDKWIKEGRSYIAENELYSYPGIGKVAIAILMENYGGKYYPSDNPRYCGHYTFHNPNGHYEKVYHLYYMYKDSSYEPEWKGMMISSDYSALINEIVRLEFDDVYWNHKEHISEYEQMVLSQFHDNIYCGKWRYWYIREEEEWKVDIPQECEG